MSLHILVPFISLSIYAILMAITLRSPRTTARRYFAGYLGAIMAWSFGSFMLHADLPPSALFWHKQMVIFALFPMPFCYWRFVYHFLGKTTPNLTRDIFLICGLAFTLLTALGFTVSEAYVIRGEIFHKFEPALYLFSLYGIGIMLVSAFYLGQAFITSSNYLIRTRLFYLLFGAILVVGLGVTNFSSSLARYPLDQFGNAANALLISYAILRHKLLNITIVLRKGMLYTILSMLMAAVYFFLVFIIQVLFRVYPGQSLLASAIVVVVISAIIFQPMYHITQGWIDRLFYREAYDHSAMLKASSEAAVTILDLGELARTIVQLVARTLRVEKLSLFVWEDKNNTYRFRSGQGYHEHDILTGDFIFRGDNPIIIQLTRCSTPLRIEEMEGFPQYQSIWRDERELLTKLEAALFVPLKARQRLVGMLVFGPKKSQQSYTDDDIQLLSTVANQMAIALDNARLYEESQLAYEQLRLTQEQLVQAERLKAMGQMSSGIAHDFNNVLTTILGRVQLALRDVQDARLKRNMEIIEQSALDAAQMVRRLQDVTGLRTDHSFEIVDLNQILESAFETIKPRLDELLETKGARIQVIINKAKISPVEGSASELREVMINILLNAIEAMPFGGELTLKSYQENNRVAITISDTGIGMSAEVKNKLFTPFFTTKGSKGLGMGLSMSYGIVRRHGGNIEVSSEPGKGSIFAINYPVAKRGHKQLISKTPPLDTGNATILVIDDDEGARQVISETLARAGHKVDTAVNGQEGLSLARRKAYDLVVADLGMPDISGRQVAKAIKSANPMIPVLIITGWGVQLDPIELKKDGVDSLIAKPFKVEEILTKVTSLLSTYTESNDIYSHEVT